jgi:hypothetical protein
VSFADDEELNEFVTKGHLVPSITPAAVSASLQDFSLAMAPDKDMTWLAMAVRRALGIAIPDGSDGPQRTSNAEIRSELERLANLAGATWLELFQCDFAAEARLWEQSWRHWEGEGAESKGEGLSIAVPTDYQRFKHGLAELDWMAHFIRGAANSTQSQRGPWRQSEEKALRVQRGQYLAPIFEAAFGQKVSANNFPNDARHRCPTAFMDFYRRMVTLAFGPRETSNLAEVVKAACKRHRHSPATFGEGLIEGL